MAPKNTNRDREDLREAAAEGIKVISNAADSAAKVIVQSAADAIRVLTAAAASAAGVVSAAAAVQTKVVDEKSGTDHEAIIKIGMTLDTMSKALIKIEDGGVVRDKRMLGLEESRASLNILISIGIGMLTLETGLLLWSLFRIHP